MIHCGNSTVETGGEMTAEFTKALNQMFEGTGFELLRQQTVIQPQRVPGLRFSLYFSV